MKNLFSLQYFACIFSFFLIYGCTKKDDSAKPSNTNKPVNTATLHYAFKTPDWERYIDCNLLDFTPNMNNDSTYVISATSASTNATFCLSYPVDSSQMVKSENLKQYKIMSIYSNNSPFQFSQKLPLDEKSLNDLSKKLISVESFSANEYNEIVEIKYFGSEPTYAVFLVSGKYVMNMVLSGDSNVSKAVSGTYTFKIRTSKH